MTPPPKCYISVGKSPEKTILSHPFNHEVDLLLPSGIYNLISQRLLSCPILANPPCYRRLVMPLATILEPDFFNAHIKTGNVLLLSQGIFGVDNVFCLSDGILRMSLDKEAYEKAGLPGKPAKFGNGLGLMKRRRWLVELNLRAPHYLTGTKSFNRLQRACVNVFKKPLVYLFADLAAQSVSKPSGASSGSSVGVSSVAVESMSSFPSRNIVPQVHTTQELLIPAFRPPQNAVPCGGGKSPIAEYNREVWHEWALEIYEYIGLLSLPAGPADRLRGNDRIDSLLSIYSIEDAKVGGVTTVRFKGMISPRFIKELWEIVEGLLASLEQGQQEEEAWTAMVIHGFENAPISWDGKQHGNIGGGENGYTILEVLGNGATGKQLMLFELVGGEDEYS